MTKLEAMHVASRIYSEPQHAGKVVDPEMCLSIGNAILAAVVEERKRCAKIARRMYSGPGPHPLSEFTSGQQQSSRDIAAAIEKEPVNDK